MPGESAPRSTKSTPEDREAFRALVPDAPDVVIRPMFGTDAAFSGGNMFMGLVHDELYLRLDEEGRAALQVMGGRPLEVMPGRPMREYVTLPGWRSRADDVRQWAAKSLDYARTLPPKKGK
jgi:TfoX/Sxy family transcriptional regulator of competence genes